MLKLRALIALKDLIIALTKHPVTEGSRKDIGISVLGIPDLYVFLIGIYAEPDIGGKGPGRGGPGEEIEILVLGLESYYGRTLLHHLIALGYLMG